LATFAFCVVTFMPCFASVVHEAGRPFMPSISTKQSRQEPNGSRLSVAQSFGMLMPWRAAARSTIVPSGTVTATPSIVSVMVLALGAGAGVPKSWARS
jgi:hypothetical protein